MVDIKEETVVDEVVAEEAAVEVVKMEIGVAQTLGLRSFNHNYFTILC